MKKILCLLLSLTMVLTMFAVPAFAAETESAVEVLSALNILEGRENGDLALDSKVTRAEMAAIICRAKNVENNVTGNTIFTDVNAEHWASGYINTAYGLGIINGYDNGKFGPEDNVTYNQAIKMIVCSLGYGVVCDTYPSSYLAYANTLKLLTNVKGSGEVAATRADIASLVYNALSAPMLVQTGFGDYEKYEVVKDDTLLSTSLEIAKVKGMVNSINFKDNEANITVIGEDKSFEEITSGTYTTNTDLTNFKNIISTIYVNVEDENEPVIVAAVASNKADIVTIADNELFVSYNEDKFQIEYYESIDDNKTQTISLTEDFVTYVNDSSDKANFNDAIKNFDSISFIDADSDGKFETVIVENIESFVVKSVNPRTMTIVVDTTAGYSFGKAKLVLDKNEVTYNIDTELEDIEPGDVINIKTSKVSNDIHYEIYVTNEKIEGIINAIDDNYYYIDNVAYKLVKGVSVKLGTTGIFTLNMKGEIIAVDTTTNATSAKWGYVIATNNKSIGFEDSYIAKVVTIDGDEEIFTFAQKLRINGENAVDTEDIYTSELSNLTGLIGYKLNSKDEISTIYTDFSEMDRDYTTTNGGSLRLKEDGRLGSYYTSDNSLIFNVKNEDKVTIQSIAGLLADEYYNITALVYDSATNEIVIAVGENVTLAANPASPVMLVKSVSYGLDDMIIVEGYVDGELVKISYDSYELEITEPIKGDLIQYSTVGTEAVGIINHGNVKTISAAPLTDFETQDEGLFVHKGRVNNIRGVNVEFFKRDLVTMPGDYATYRYDSRDRILTDEFIEDITLETLRGENEPIEYLVVVKYDNIPLIAVIVEN